MKTKNNGASQIVDQAQESYLIAAAAHELKNPIQALINSVHLLQERPNLDTGTKALLGTMSAEVARLQQITKQTLGFYGKPEDKATVDLAQVLDAVIAFYKGKIAFKRIIVEKRYDSLALVEGCAEQIRQVFTNLVVNALEALPAVGKLTVRIVDSSDWASCLRGTRVVLADNGSGIALENKKRLFDPFFTTKDKGTGIGLWVTKNIIRNHGGSIRVRSSTQRGNSGTCFRIFFPHSPGKMRTLAPCS